MKNEYRNETTVKCFPLVAIVISIMVLLNMLTTSCSKDTMPEYSENFDEAFIASFPDNYILHDSHLAYCAATQWEVEIKPENHDADKLRLALINGVDKSDFISCTEIYGYIYGPKDYNNYVYQSEAAPVPMRDWTIKSVSVIEATTSPYTDVCGSPSERAEKLMESFLAQSNNLHTYERDSDKDLIDSFVQSYNNATDFNVNMIPKEIRGEPDSENFTQAWYSLLIRFEESDNIVWHTYLYESDDGMYFECSLNDTVTEESTDTGQNTNSTSTFALIDAAYAEEIRSLIPTTVN